MKSMVKALSIPKGAPKRLAKSRAMGISMPSAAPKKLAPSRVGRANTSTRKRKMSAMNASPLRNAYHMGGN